MIRTHAATLLIPLVAFACAIGAAGVVTSQAQDRPTYRLYDRIAAYLDEMTEGRVPVGFDASAGGRRHAAERAQLYRGRMWVIHGLEPAAEGRIRAVVGFYRPDGRGHRETQVWTEGPDGIWRFLGLEEARKGAAPIPRGESRPPSFQ